MKIQFSVRKVNDSLSEVTASCEEHPDEQRAGLDRYSAIGRLVESHGPQHGITIEKIDLDD